MIKLIGLTRRQPIYSDSEDQIGPGVEVSLLAFDAAALERSRAKARHHLRQQESHPAVQKIPNNQPLTEYDLAELERLLLQAGIATIDNLTQAKAASERFALFIRALVGMDRAAAKAAFDKFLTNKLPSANQIQFINHIIDHLTGQGYMKPECLYESPFTDLHPKGVDGLFASNEVDDLVATLRSIRTSAAAA